MSPRTCFSGHAHEDWFGGAAARAFRRRSRRNTPAGRPHSCAPPGYLPARTTAANTTNPIAITTPSRPADISPRSSRGKPSAGQPRDEQGARGFGNESEVDERHREARSLLGDDQIAVEQSTTVKAMPGHTVARLPPAERARWDKVVTPVIDAWISETPNGAAIWAAYKKEVENAKAMN